MPLEVRWVTRPTIRPPIRLGVSLAALCAIPIACRTSPPGTWLSVEPGDAASRPSVAVGGAASLDASAPAVHEGGLDPAQPSNPWRELALDPDAFVRFAAPLVPHAEPPPPEHPFTGPWQPLSPGLVEPFLHQPEDSDQDDSGHWSGLPLMSDLAKENGIKLPEPFGLTATYFVINRPSRVTKVKAGINNGGLVELPSLAFEANAKVQSALARLDAWILPMLNVYLLGGYVWNDSSVDMVLDLPGAPNTAFTADGHLEGPVYGAGTTLVGGYGNYFMLVDFNWSTVMLKGLSEMDAKLLTARVGYRMPDISWADEVRFYLATTYWDTARTISGSIPFSSGGISSIQYAVDQEPVDSLTVGGGTNIVLNKNWGFTCEVQGYSKTIYVVGALNLRF
jgi:hypothetical protein